MKKLYLFLALAASTASFSQNPLLFETVWNLSVFNQNGVDYFPPVNNGDPNVRLSFDVDTSGLQTNVCNYLFGSVDFGTSTDSFSLLEHYVTLSFCNNPANDTFDSLYLGFYLDELPTNYGYTITESNGIKTLTITNDGGSYAVYSDEALSVKEQMMSQVSLFPNPASDYIALKMGNAIFENAQIEIYDSLGKRCKTEKITSDSQNFDIGDLSKGIYLMKINVDNKTTARKFIKS